MKRLLLRLAILVLTFGLGITVSAIWRFCTVDLPFSAHLPARASRLEVLTVGYGSDGSTTYLSNGGRITRTCQIFPSAAEANDVLQERRRAASDVVEWSDLVDDNDRPVGQTILILKNPTVIRLSTHREMLCETRTSSMNEMRWFDNRESR